MGEVADLTEAMAGRGLLDDDEIRPTTKDFFLATDSERDWGAAFRFWVAEDGEAYCDCTKTQRRAGGGWADIGSGGSHFGGWDVPWRPPAGGWDDGQMLVMTTVGQTVFDPREEASELIAVGGFVAPSVRAILSVHDGHERTISVSSPVGAFVVVAVGSGSVTLTPLGADGTPVGPGRRFE